MAALSQATRSEASVKRLTLVATIMGSGIALLDGTVVNVALPTIQRALGGGLAGQQWVSNGYLLTLGSLILIGGSLSDLYGRRRVFALGVGAFAATSALCAVAPTSELLIAARALQGVGGAAMFATALALIGQEFEGRERGKAIAAWGATVGFASAVGPLLGGSVTDLVCVLGREVSIEEINDAFRSASGEGGWNGILEYTEDPIVSSDIVGNSHSCIIDSLSTMANGRMVKVIGWYDNEWGYSCRLADLVELMSRTLTAEPVGAQTAE